jgi:bifunctional non-homologous end joining protein LigD
MKATLGSLPTDDDRWAYELKFDGYRTLAFIDGSAVRVQSSNLHDVTVTYPELGELASGVHAATAILDGELAVLDAEGRPRFELMQRHLGEAVFHVFDVLHIDDHDTTELPYEDRRTLLAQLVEPGDNWVVPAHRVGDGVALLEATMEQGLEGIIAKRLGSLYVPAKRSPNWRKVKNRRRIDVLIGGYTSGEGNRSSTFGSLLVGRYDGDSLVFAGGVGTGFDHRLLESLSAQLRELRIDDCPFEPEPPASYRRNATWVEPTLRATIEMTELTNGGLVRHASFIKLASD